MQWLLEMEIGTPIIWAWIILQISARPFIRRRLHQLATRSHNQPRFSLCPYEYSLHNSHFHICSSLQQCKEVDLYGNTIVPRVYFTLLFLLGQGKLKTYPRRFRKKKTKRTGALTFWKLRQGVSTEELVNSITHYWPKIEKVSESFRIYYMKICAERWVLFVK